MGNKLTIVDKLKEIDLNSPDAESQISELISRENAISIQANTVVLYDGKGKQRNDRYWNQTWEANFSVLDSDDCSGFDWADPKDHYNMKYSGYRGMYWGLDFVFYIIPESCKRLAGYKQEKRYEYTVSQIRHLILDFMKSKGVKGGVRRGGSRPVFPSIYLDEFWDNLMENL